ncbi:SDR family oxidoreductase [Bordetella genomosp. 11]|uniref:Short-chain dehydrogenase n=1 Tax=Bordetella genomosp. 11 TaxID=1416808 RepID=A0A261UFT8_9BORD|nr:SDR family oxidoreductase [Bordetella genomosp. 11]OZI60455.1 short-chain dehydrogenase [Bordetella genomosp. 11]
MEIKGRVALVTGANRGLGKAIAQALLQAGAAKVYAGARDPGSVDLPGVVPVELDVTDVASVRAAAQRCGDVEIVVNNAGISLPGTALSEDAPDRIRRLFDVNFYGVLNVSSAFAPILARNGGGTFVNVLSVLSWLAIEGSTHYSASKAAAWALTNGMRRELKEQNIRVTGVHVGYMDTDMVARLDAPKTAPSVAAGKIVEAIREERPELLIDDTSRTVKASLSLDAAAYL